MITKIKTKCLQEKYKGGVTSPLLVCIPPNEEKSIFHPLKKIHISILAFRFSFCILFVMNSTAHRRNVFTVHLLPTLRATFFHIQQNRLLTNLLHSSRYQSIFGDVLVVCDSCASFSTGHFLGTSVFNILELVIVRGYLQQPLCL